MEPDDLAKEQREDIEAQLQRDGTIVYEARVLEASQIPHSGVADTEAEIGAAKIIESHL